MRPITGGAAMSENSPNDPIDPDSPTTGGRGTGGLGQATRIVDLGLRVALSCAIGVGGGFWIDRSTGLLGRFPVFTIVGCFLGLAAGMVALFRGLKPPGPSGSAGGSVPGRGA